MRSFLCVPRKAAIRTLNIGAAFPDDYPCPYQPCRPGVTITVMPGVYTDYTGGWGFGSAPAGRPHSPIVLRSQVNGGAVIDGQDGSDRNTGIYIEGKLQHRRLEFEITGAPKTGIAISAISNQILNNEIHHNGNPRQYQLHMARMASISDKRHAP